MSRNTFISNYQSGLHKGFYNDVDFSKTLTNIRYTDFFKYPDDEEFSYDSVHDLLCGSCNIFALSLKRIFGYNVLLLKTTI